MKLGFVLALITAASWGVLPIALKLTLQGMDPVTITWYRFAAAALVLGAILAVTGGLPTLHSLSRRIWLLLALAITGLTSNYVLYLVALSHTTPSVAQIVIQLAPVFLLLGGLFVFRETFSTRQWAGFALLMLGLVLFFNRRLPELLNLSTDTGLGTALLVLAAIVWAVYGLAQKQLTEHLRPQQILWLVYLGAVLVLFPAASIGTVRDLEALQLWMLIFCCANTLIAYGAFAEGAAGRAFDRRERMLRLAAEDLAAAERRFTGDMSERAKLGSYGRSIESLLETQEILRGMRSSVVAPPAIAGGLAPLARFHALVDLAVSTLIDDLTHVAVVGSGTGGSFSLTYSSISGTGRHDMQHTSGGDPAMLQAIRDVNRAQVAAIAAGARRLADAGLLDRDDDRRIRVGIRLWELATRSSFALQLRQSARPAMERVARAPVRDRHRRPGCIRRRARPLGILAATGDATARMGRGGRLRSRPAARWFPSRLSASADRSRLTFEILNYSP